jgi:hypothetical protein
MHGSNVGPEWGKGEHDVVLQYRIGHRPVDGQGGWHVLTVGG